MSRERKQWRIGQPVPVANSRVTYPVRLLPLSCPSHAFISSQVGDRRRSLSPPLVSPIPELSKILKEDTLEDIHKVNLISELSDTFILMRNLWIPCWVSTKQNSLFWMEDSKASDLQASFHSPSSHQTILASTVQRAGYSPVHAALQCRRRSWGGTTLTSGSNKENQDERWMLGYVSALFNQRSSSQKIFFQAEEARRVGIRSVIPVFLKDFDLDVAAPFLILLNNQFRFSLPPLSQTIIVDSTGAVLSVTFKKTLPLSASKDSALTQQKSALSQSLSSTPDSTPSSHLFLNCTHFHSLHDIETLESILSNLDLEDPTSFAEWIPILDKDSNLLLRELYQILVRSLSFDFAKGELELQVVRKSSSLVLLCWKIHPHGVPCDTHLTGDLFVKILTLFYGPLNSHLDTLIPLIHVAIHISRSSEGGLPDKGPENLVVGKFLQYLLSVEIDSPLSECVTSLLSTLWFRNILREQRVGVPQLVDSPSCCCILLRSQLSCIVSASDEERLSDIFAIPSTPLRFEALVALIPPVCTWTIHLLDRLSSSDTSDKGVRSREDLFQQIVTLRLMVTSLTLLLLIQEKAKSSLLVFPVDWSLVHHTLRFLLSHNNLSSHRAEFLKTMTQLVDFLSFVFVDLGWLRNKDNGSRHRDTILQVTHSPPPLPQSFS